MADNERNINKILTDIAFTQREYEQPHHPYDLELKRYGQLREGKDDVIDTMVESFINNRSSHLSSDPLRCKQYLFVVCLTIATRNAIEGGVNAEEAYNLSDHYISAADICRTIDDIALLYREALHKIVMLVRESQRNSIYSPYVLKALDYIHLHLHSAITIGAISQHLGLTPNYLSALFSKETSTPIATYVRAKKIYAAQNLLKYSEYAPTDIGNYLAFSSHSHFISVFKKATGMTPKEYRDHYFRRNK
ncbi:MAG: helix-turn-helix domain-containing protein [Lachnospiraceae bacterium]|nr:helix-turn-helix domain-containing protein [Lachnospiraceae bacterium]